MQSVRTAGNKGFSLIELLVVTGIISILAGVAIPSYNKYRERAVLASFDATGMNIVRAFQACMTLRSLRSCDTLSELNVSCDICTRTRLGTGLGQSKTGPGWCVQLRKDIAGNNFIGCYDVHIRTGVVRKFFNERVCYNDDGQGNKGSLELSSPPGQTPDTVYQPLTKCLYDSHCQDVGAVFCHGSLTANCWAGFCNL